MASLDTSVKNNKTSPAKRLIAGQTLLLALIVFALALIPRLWQLDYFLMVDENLWYQRSAQFLQGLTGGDLSQTVQTGHPGVTTMWAGSVGLALHYLQSALSGETLSAFAARMTLTPVDLNTLRLLRLPIALVSAAAAAVSFALGRQLWGTQAALIGAGLLAFEPFFLAHSRALHHDALATDFSIIAVLSWLLYLKESRNRFLFISGMSTTLAILSKISSLFLLGFAGLTLLPRLWQMRRASGAERWRPISPWFKLAGVVILTALFVWPALWFSPAQVWETIWGFFLHERGAHANGSFFMGQPVPDPGFFFYPLGLLFILSPLTLAGILLAALGLGGDWRKQRRGESVGQDSLWAGWLFLYAILFVLFISFIGKKQSRYALPAAAAFDILAGWGWYRLVFVWLIPKVNGSKLAYLLSSLLIGGQLAFALPTAPYYATFYNPLLGGAPAAQKRILIGRGEGLEQAAQYVQSQSALEKPTVSTWYGTTVKILFGQTAYVKDVAHPHFILESDYVFFYINQLQRRRPNAAILDYVQKHLTLLHTISLAGIDYVHIYQGKAIDHPTDTFAPQNGLAGKVKLAGFELEETPTAGAVTPLSLYWLNNGMKPGEHFYVRLTDSLEQDWAWGACQSDPAFGDAAAWQEDDIIESECQLAVYPGTPPGNYLLRAGVMATDGTVIGQINLSETEGTVTTDAPETFPPDEWIPVETPVQSALNEHLYLIGYDYTPLAHKPGDLIPLTLYWRALKSLSDDYTIRLSLEGDKPGQLAQWEDRPVNGRYPTTNWQANEVVRDPWQLKLPPSLPGGTYTFSLTLIDQNNNKTKQFTLPPVTVEGRKHLFDLPHPPISQTARLGDSIGFLGYALTETPLQPGGVLTTTLFWQAERAPADNYVVFVQLLDANNQLVAQHDSQPGNNTLVTTTWAKGEYVLDTHRLTLPADLAPGKYHLIVGMYRPESGERLPVFGPGGQAIGDHLSLNAPLLTTNDQ